MPDQIHVSVRSNVDALSAARLHQALLETVESTVADATAFLRAVEPKDTGSMEAHTDHTHAEDVTGMIEAKLGITPIEDAGMGSALKSIPGAQDSSHYPLFVDRGTGVFGPIATPIFARTGSSMHFEIDGRSIFARSVLGQRGQHFMAATYAFAQAAIRTDPHIRLALDEMAAEAAAMALGEEA